MAAVLDGMMAGVDGMMAGVDVVMAGVDGMAADSWLVAADDIDTLYYGDEDSAAAISEVKTNFNGSSIPLILLII